MARAAIVYGALIVIGIVAMVMALALMTSPSTPAERAPETHIEIREASDSIVVIVNRGEGTIMTNETAVYREQYRMPCSWDVAQIGWNETAVCTMPIPCSGAVVRVFAGSATAAALCG